MAENKNQGREMTISENWRVFQNVLLIMTFLLFSSMCCIGCVYFHDCPIQPMLAIYMIVQGISGLSMPILYIIKYRCSVGESMTRITFLTVFISLFIGSIVFLIGGTHLLVISECGDSQLNKACTGFVVILWLASITTTVVSCIKGFLYCKAGLD